jgi:glycogen operon protein
MTTEDWQDPAQRVLGMFVSGSPLRAPGPHGEQQLDSSFLLWLNGTAQDAKVHLPANDWVSCGEVVLSTHDRLPVGTQVEAGETITLGARSLVLIRAS